MGQTQSLPQSQSQTQPSIQSQTTVPTAIKTSKTAKKLQPYATSFFEAQMLDSDVNTRRVKKSAPNYFEVASVTPQPIRKSSSAYNVSTSSSSLSAKTSSSTSSIKKIYPEQQSLSISTIPPSKDREDSSKIPTTYNSDTEYFIINNRRYWKDSKNNQVKFMLPCDDDESDRLMSLHYILKSVFGGNFTSPIRELLSNNTSVNNGNRPKVLDIGCGSGTWILEMATEFPNSDFYGIDQCSLFPVSIKPSNSYFQSHEVPNALPFEDNTFDFVFMRMVILHLHPDNVVSLLREVSRILKPGGYFEVIDTDYIIKRPGYMTSTQINEEVIKLFYPPNFSSLSHENSSIHPLFTHIMLSSQMTGASALPFYGEFVDINQHQTSIQLGGNGERISEVYAENYQLFLNSVARRNDNIKLFDDMDLNQIMKECQDHESYVDWFVCFARKPVCEQHEKIPISNNEQSTLDSIYEFIDGFDDEISFFH